jgi:transcription elongation factor GreA
MDTPYLSQEKFNELQKELDDLRNVSRLEVADHLKRAKEYGDLSENAEYAEAREEQSRIETRIGELDEILKSAVIIHKGTGGDLVTVGCTVTVKKAGKTIEYIIVGSNESDPAANKISNESPLGRAFLNHKVGDVVKVTTPAGVVEYSIVKIS